MPNSILLRNELEFGNHMDLSSVPSSVSFVIPSSKCESLTKDLCLSFTIYKMVILVCSDLTVLSYGIKCRCSVMKVIVPKIVSE